jgi:hypothetical protein
MKSLMCFKICGPFVFHGLKQLLGSMVWLHKFSVKFAAILKESQSCHSQAQHTSKTCWAS